MARRPPAGFDNFGVVLQNFRMWVPRTLASRLESITTDFPAVLLTGARQTGKTSLLRKRFPGHHYVSLDLPSDAALAEQSPGAFFQAHPEPVLIDEVQYAPALFRHLKVRIDQSRHTGGRYLLTGSQRFSLMREASESLAGRLAVVELEGVSVQELLGADVEAPVDEILSRGQFPELWRNRRLSAVDFHRSYLSTYIERDVRQIVNVSSLRDFERFMRLCATRNGQLLNKAELARGVGVTGKTVDQWLGVLVASGVVSLVEPWFGNIGKRIVKAPKLYFSDTGLLTHLLGLDRSSLATSPQLGAIWEAFVGAELRKTLASDAPERTLWFYRDQQGREVDFVVQGAGGFHLIEVKWSELPSVRDGRSLRVLAELLQRTEPAPAFVRCAIVARPPRSFPLEAGLEVVSVADLPDWLVGHTTA